MNKIQLHMLAFIFAALLPPKKSSGQDENENEDDYYKVLGLQNQNQQPPRHKITKDDIRRAYKKKSLQYHPDKVAQNRNNNNNNNNRNRSAEEIRRDFVLIKEAYEVLSNEEKRNLYDVLGKGGLDMFDEKHGDDEGYGDVGSGSGSGSGLAVDPNAVLLNLANASCINKTKLFALVILAISIILVGPILLCLKVDGFYEDVLWIYILIPLWILQFLTLFLALLNYAWAISLKIFSIIVLEVFLGLKLDGFIIWRFAIIFIPLYVHGLVSFVEYTTTIRQVRSDVARMVTVSYLEEKILPNFKMDDDNDGNGEEEKAEILNENEVTNANATSGGRRSYNDLTDEEKEYLNELYIIVTNIVDEEDEDEANEDGGNGNGNKKTKSPYSQLDPEIKVLFDIADSPEFQHAAYRKKMAQRSLFFLITSRLSFVILLVLQLETEYVEDRWDWNVVFIPIWIELGLSMLWNCFVCCCAGTSFGGDDLRGGEKTYHDIDLDDLETEEERKMKDKKTGEDGVGDGKENDHADVEMGRGDINADGVKASVIMSGTAVTTNNEKESDGDGGDDELSSSDSGFIPVSYTPLLKTDENDDDNVGNNNSGDLNNGKKNSLLNQTTSDDNKVDSGYQGGSSNVDNDSGDSDSDSDDDQYEYGDPNILQRRSQAAGNCCNFTVLLVILALFITKLNNKQAIYDNIGQYSSLWVLFPIFFFSGLLLCSCAICIYARPEKLQDMVSRRSQTNNGNNNNSNDNNGNTTAQNNENLNTNAPPTTPEDAVHDSGVGGDTGASLGGDSDDLD